MSKLLGVAIMAVIIYFLLTQGMPWLQTAMGTGGSAEGSESDFCISQTSEAVNTIADELVPAAYPPVDAGVWGTALVRGGRVLAAAESACTCPTAACAKAYEAVQELRGLYDELDDLARGNPMGFGNPARRVETVNERLRQARVLASSE